MIVCDRCLKKVNPDKNELSEVEVSIKVDDDEVQKFKIEACSKCICDLESSLNAYVTNVLFESEQHKNFVTNVTGKKVKP